ncbi:hypothetical protein D3C78_1421500 [compost metagenome]
MVGEQIDVVRQQQAQTLLHPARDAAVVAAPEKTVVDKNGIGTQVDGGLDQRAAGSDATDQPGDAGLAFNLQTVGPVVLEALGLQQVVEAAQQVLSREGHGAIVAPMPSGIRTFRRRGPASPCTTGARKPAPRPAGPLLPRSGRGTAGRTAGPR